MKETGKKSASQCLRFVQTSNVFLALFALGLVSAIIGPTLNDLKNIYDSSIKATIQLLTLRGAGVFVGSLLSSCILYRYFNGKLCLAIAMMLGGLSHALIPRLPSLTYAAVTTLAAGMCVGVLETGGNVWLVQLWKEKVGPIFQMYHLSFGIGALLSPVLVAPYLQYKKQDTEDVNGTLTELYTESHVDVPYALFGASYAFVGLLMMILYFIDSSNVTQQGTSDTNNTGEGNGTLFEVKIVSHLVLYILVLVGIEVTVAQMLSVYVTQNKLLTFDVHSATYLVADYWASFTTGRIVAIVLAFKLPPYTILIISNIICISGASILLIFGATQNWAMWVGIGTLGFGLAPCYGAAMSWAVRYVKLRYVHMTLVLVASCVGQMAPPLTVGLYIKAYPTVFVYAIAGYMIVHTINVSVMYLTTKDVNEKVVKVVEPVPATDMVDIPEI